MSSKKEEEKNEKIIRGLMKLPPNRRCINCNSLGPQYVCTNFWTFVCIACSGVHREFTHRVKSVSMAKFTTQEVEALQRGGNQRAKELFLKDGDSQQMRLPDNSNPDKVREFIKNVYVDKKYAGSRSSDKPPRDTQSHKGEEDHRRASSYHSFSQSPPYDHQYEERRYGRQAGMLTRKPGSDRGHYEGKISSFLYSPGRQAEQMYEDRFANESSSRMSDFSVSSDPYRFDGQSPNFCDPGYGSPPSQERDIYVKDARSQKLGGSSESNVEEDMNRISRAHRSASSGSFGSFDGNSISLKSANSGSVIDSVLETEHASGTQHADTLAFPPSPQISSAANTAKIDLFNQEFVQAQNTLPQISYAANTTEIDFFNQESVQSQNPVPQISFPANTTKIDLFNQEFGQSQNSFSASSIDLFADVNHQPSAIPPNEQKPPAVPLSENEGWATFDFPHHAEPSFKASQGFPPIVRPGEKDAPKGSIDLFSTMHSNSDWFSVQNPLSHGHSSLVADQWSMGLNEGQKSADSNNSQLWNAFDDSTGNIPQTLSGILPQNIESQDLIQRLPKSVDPYVGFKAPEGRTTQERKATNPFDLPYDTDSEINNVRRALVVKALVAKQLTMLEFLDMSSLEGALPEPQLPTTFLSGLESWFPQNSHTSFIPPVPQGGLAYIGGGQVPSTQLQNIPSQGPVASLGGNPFA